MKLYNNTIIPLEAQYLYRRGLEMIDQQKEDVALVYLRQAVFIAPGFSKAYQELGNCLSQARSPGRSISIPSESTPDRSDTLRYRR